MNDWGFEFPDLSSAVVDARNAMVDASIRCDIEGLVQIAQRNGGFRYSLLASDAANWIDDWRCETSPSEFTVGSGELVPYWRRDDIHADLTQRLVDTLNGSYRLVEAGDGLVADWGNPSDVVQV